MKHYMFWLISGVIMLGAEFFVPGFVVFFFGTGAVLASILCILYPETSLLLEIAVFLISALVMLALSRRLPAKLLCSQQALPLPDIALDNISGSTATAITGITPENIGKVVFKESLWSAVSGEEIKTGETVRIISCKNEIMIVEKNK